MKGKKMKQYVVLFRGINVGGHNKLPMKPLVSVLEGAGFSQVNYYIQSGNVVLSAESEPTQVIKNLVKAHFSLSPQMMVLTTDNFSSVARHNPYQQEEGKLVHCFICNEIPMLDIAKVEKYQIDSEQYTLVNNALYLFAPEGIGRSKFATNMESCLGVSATARNLNTMNKICEMLD